MPHTVHKKNPILDNDRHHPHEGCPERNRIINEEDHRCVWVEDPGTASIQVWGNNRGVVDIKLAVCENCRREIVFGNKRQYL